VIGPAHIGAATIKPVKSRLNASRSLPPRDARRNFVHQRFPPCRACCPGRHIGKSEKRRLNMLAPRRGLPDDGIFGCCFAHTLPSVRAGRIYHSRRGVEPLAFATAAAFSTNRGEPWRFCGKRG